MSMLLQHHWMHARPTILGTVSLGTLIFVSGNNTSLHCVRKKGWGSRLYLIILSFIGKQRVKDVCKNVCGLFYSIQSLSLVNIPTSGKGLRIDLLAFCGLDITKARCRVKAGQVVSIQDFDMQVIDI